MLNSIIHRSYYFSGISESRNPNLAEIFHRLNYVENYGTGIERIINEYDDSDFKPFIELSENVFKITLPNKNYQEQKQIVNNKISKEQKILEFLKDNQEISRDIVENMLDLSKSGARKIINKIIENNLIIQKGIGRNIYYVLK